MTEEAVVLGTARTNRASGSVIDVKASIDTDLLLLDPRHERVLVVPGDHAGAFLREANQMEVLCQDLVQSRESVLTLEDRLAQLRRQRFPDLLDVHTAERELQRARKAYDAAHAAVKTELGDKDYLASSGDGKEILELIPLARRSVNGRPQPWARKWTYVRSDSVRNHWRAYAFNAKEQGQGKSFIRNGRVDTRALGQQLTKLEPKLKAEWQLGHDAGFVFPKLQAWAETLNHESEAGGVSFAYGVQLFRYFVGCASSTEWNPLGGKVAGKIKGRAELMIARGECSAKGHLPDADGWAWALTGMKSGREFHIGAMRLFGEVKLIAAAGASAAAELGLEVDYSRLTQAGVKGARRPKDSDATASKASLDKLGGEAGAGVDLFAGVKAGGEFKGALQYQSPEANDRFEDLASIGPKVDVQFGAGAAACLMVDYRDGKFRIRAKAGLCLGLGAKGELGLEVDFKRLGNFLGWLFHALLNANFEFLQVLTGRCYESAVQLQVMTLNGLEDVYSDVTGRWGKFQDRLELEDQRIALMNRVLSNPTELRMCVPEAHGILLHQLTRHGSLTKLNLANTGWEFELMGRRKRAVLQICRWAQCKRQFENMVQHMGPNGEKGGFEGNFEGLLRFMELGLLNSHYDDELRRLYARLPDEPARGYAVAMNHTGEFRTQVLIGASPMYAAAMEGRGAGLTRFA